MSKTTNSRSRRSPAGVAFVTVAVFLAVLVLLGSRLQNGKDPVIGSKAVATVPVVHKTVVVRRKIVKLVRDLPPLPAKTASASSGSGGSSSAASSSGSGSAQSTYSAPQQTVTTAPAPAPAPATSAS